MKKTHIKNLLKKGNLSPFMVAKLIFNDKWRNNLMQEPILSDHEKDSLVNNIPSDEYHQYKNWTNWFKDIDKISSEIRELYLDSQKTLFQILWFIDKDLAREDLKVYFKNMYPIPVTGKQYHDLKRKDRESKLKEKYSVTSCLIGIIEDKLPGPEKGLTLEDYIYQDDDFKAKDRKLIARLFSKSVNKIISYIDQGKIKPTRKKQLLSALKAVLKKNSDQIAEILLAGIYADIEAPVKILELSTITGEQLYKNFKEWAKYIDTFYSETSGGYAIVQEVRSLFLDQKGYYKPVSPIARFFSDNNRNLYPLLVSKLKYMADCFDVFQFYRMFLDVLSEKLSIPLNQGNEKIGIESLKNQAQYLDGLWDLLFSNLTMISFRKDSEKKLSELLEKYEHKTLDKYYPSQKVVEFCKTKINKPEYEPDWFYDIKDFYMKEDRIKAMSDEEIEHLEAIGNKDQVKHFRELVEASGQGVCGMF